MGAPRKVRQALKAMLVVTVIIAVVVLSRQFDLQERLRGLMATIESYGSIGYLVFVVTYVLACVLFLPGTILTLGAGFAYGVGRGTALVSLASTLGATAAFLVGRYLARSWVTRKVGKNAKFKAIDDAVANEGWKVVALTRLSPVFPFNLLNYAFGLTGVSLKSYVLSSWLGMLPGTIMFVYAGSMAGDLANATDRTRTDAEWVLYGVGLVATVVVTVYVTKVAKKALHQTIRAEEQERPV